MFGIMAGMDQKNTFRRFSCRGAQADSHGPAVQQAIGVSTVAVLVRGDRCHSSPSTPAAQLESQDEAEAESPEEVLWPSLLEERYPEVFAPNSSPDGRTHFRHRFSWRSRWTLPAGAVPARGDGVEWGGLHRSRPDLPEGDTARPGRDTNTGRRDAG